jgi:CBS domain-containing protein
MPITDAIAVRDIMKTEVITIGPDAPVSDLVRKLEKASITGVPVVDEEEEILGVVTSHDVLHLAGDLIAVPEAMQWGLGLGSAPAGTNFVRAPLEGEFFAYYVTPDGKYVDVRDNIRELSGDVFEGYSISEIMTPDPVTIEADASLPEAARLLRDEDVRRALVVSSGKLVGIVTATDIIRAVAEL